MAGPRQVQVLALILSTGKNNIEEKLYEGSYVEL